MGQIKYQTNIKAERIAGVETVTEEWPYFEWTKQPTVVQDEVDGLVMKNCTKKLEYPYTTWEPKTITEMVDEEYWVEIEEEVEEMVQVAVPLEPKALTYTNETVIKEED